MVVMLGTWWLYIVDKAGDVGGPVDKWLVMVVVVVGGGW